MPATTTLRVLHAVALFWPDHAPELLTAPSADALAEVVDRRVRDNLDPDIDAGRIATGDAIDIEDHLDAKRPFDALALYACAVTETADDEAPFLVAQTAAVVAVPEGAQALHVQAAVAEGLAVFWAVGVDEPAWGAEAIFGDHPVARRARATVPVEQLGEPPAR